MTAHKKIDTPKKHGGSRPGAGRKQNSGKFKEPTQSVRIPMRALALVTDWLDQLKQSSGSSLPNPFPFLKNVTVNGTPSF